MAAVPGLIVSDVNFNFSCFVPNQGFSFFGGQVWFPTVFASSGHCVLLKFGLQDTLSYKVLRKIFNAGVRHKSLYIPRQPVPNSSGFALQVSLSQTDIQPDKKQKQNKRLTKQTNKQQQTGMQTDKPADRQADTQ